jgi:hypothetical protein
MIKFQYLFDSSHDLFEEVPIDGVHRWQVGLAVLQQEVVELLLGLHLRAELVHVHSLEVHWFLESQRI